METEYDLPKMLTLARGLISAQTVRICWLQCSVRAIFFHSKHPGYWRLSDLPRDRRGINTSLLHSPNHLRLSHPCPPRFEREWYWRSKNQAVFWLT